MVLLTTFTPENSEKSRRAADGLSLLEQLAEASVAQVTPVSPLKKINQDAENTCKSPKAPILFGRHKTENKTLVIRTRCKMWNCPVCGARKAKKAVAYALNHINRVGGQWYFMTLTAHEKWRGDASHENFTRNWHKLRKRMRYFNGGEQFDYFRVWEHHKDGTLHMHILTNCYLPYSTHYNKKGEKTHYSGWLKRNARQCGIGFMADFQPLENAGFAAHYVAKYMAKSMDDSVEWKKGLRRYQTSQGWTTLPDLTESTDFDWQYLRNSSHAWFEAYQAQDAGFEIYVQGVAGKRNAQDVVDFFLRKKKGIRESGKAFYEQDWFKAKQNQETVQ